MSKGKGIVRFFNDSFQAWVREDVNEETSHCFHCVKQTRVKRRLCISCLFSIPNFVCDSCKTEEEGRQTLLCLTEAGNESLEVTLSMNKPFKWQTNLSSGLQVSLKLAFGLVQGIYDEERERDFHVMSDSLCSCKLCQSHNGMKEKVQVEQTSYPFIMTIVCP